MYTFQNQIKYTQAKKHSQTSIFTYTKLAGCTHIQSTHKYSRYTHIHTKKMHLNKQNTYKQTHKDRHTLNPTDRHTCIETHTYTYIYIKINTHRKKEQDDSGEKITCLQTTLGKHKNIFITTRR